MKTLLPHLSLHFRTEVAGGHTHVALFAGPDEDQRAKCGDVVFRNEEWAVLEPALERLGGAVELPDQSFGSIDVTITERGPGSARLHHVAKHHGPFDDCDWPSCVRARIMANKEVRDGQ